jgi:hypothetical protein
MLSDIPNSLEYFTRNVPRGDFKIIVMSAIEDEEEISKIKLHPRVSGFIKKGSQDPYQWIKFTKILTDLFK